MVLTIDEKISRKLARISELQDRKKEALEERADLDLEIEGINAELEEFVGDVSGKAIASIKPKKSDAERSATKREKAPADRDQNKNRHGGGDDERTQRIIAALNRKEKAGAIAAVENVSAQTVYNIKAKAKAQGLLKENDAEDLSDARAPQHSESASTSDTPDLAKFPYVDSVSLTRSEYDEVRRRRDTYGDTSSTLAKDLKLDEGQIKRAIRTKTFDEYLNN